MPLMMESAELRRASARGAVRLERSGQVRLAVDSGIYLFTPELADFIWDFGLC